MLLTDDQILQAFAWGPPKIVRTRSGQEKQLRTAPSTPETHDYYLRNRSALAVRGVVHGLKYGCIDTWEFCWWSSVPKAVLEERERSLRLSMATDVDLEVPMPDGESLRGYQRAGVHFALARHGTLIGDDMGLGKEQPVNMPVLTPDGWKPIGELKVGDRVTGLDGWSQSVAGVFPQGKKRAYLVEFCDGTSVECGLEHLWSVRNLNGTSRGRPFHVLPLSQIMQRLHESWEVPVMAAAVFNQNHSLPIPPYLLGVIIGDGAMKSPGITFVPGDQRVPEEVAKVIPSTMEVRRNADYGSSTRYSVCCVPRKKIHPYAEWIREQGLNVTGEHKFIPSIYLFAGYDSRRDLLRGLMDTDGTSSGTRLRFQTTSPRLADDVAHLIRSLGGIASTSCYRPKRTNELPLYTVCFSRVGNPFTDRQMHPPKARIRKVIVKVTPLDEVEQVCIQVSNPDHLYITRDFIVTHNTAQAIGVLNMQPKWRDVLIICPNRVRLNWVKELQRFSLHQRTVGLAEDGIFPQSEVVVIHYQVLTKFEAKLNSRLWDLVVVDEIHRLKNPKAKSTRVVFGFSASREEQKKGLRSSSGIPNRRRIGLTGTPICNYPRELFPIISWLDPINWGNQWKFLCDYCGGRDAGFKGATRLTELQKKLRETVMIRREKRDVAKEIPPKVRQLVPLPATTDAAREALRRERQACGGDLTKLDSLLTPETFKGSSIHQLARALAIPFEEVSKIRHETALAKLPACIEFIEDLLEDTEKLVIFFHHRVIGQQLLQHFKAEGAVLVIGGQDPRESEQLKTKFVNDPECRVFIASLMAAGTGLDGLQHAACNVVFVEDDWVPGNIDQAEDRLCRIGQLHQVICWHLMLAGSIDARVMSFILEKTMVIRAALNSSHTDDLEGDHTPEIEPQPPKKRGLFGAKKFEIGS